jgi:membrane protease subunit (stomatin/prohibitin family)
VRVADPGLFLREIVGTDGEFTKDEITFQIRNIIVQEVSRVLAQSGIPVLDMAANTDDLGKLVATPIAPVAAYGLTIPEFYIENISLPAGGRGRARQADLDGDRGRPLALHAVPARPRR